jgi:putative transposase
MIIKGHSLAIDRQCELLGINRSSYYYQANGESCLNLELMRLMDECYLKHPYYGAKRMHKWLTMDLGYRINLKRINRLYYTVMGLQSVLPGKHTTKRNKAHKVYPYLLRNLSIERPNHVWVTDITYIPIKKGFMYLTAFMDIYSRRVLSWNLSNSMDAEWCSQVLQEAVEVYGLPEIINTDQGSQYTSEVFTSCVLESEIRLSMDGKGRATDNAFIERLWRNVKYEEIYLNPPEDGLDLHLKLVEYFNFYNNQRRHEGIEYRKPIEVYNETSSDQTAVIHEIDTYKQKKKKQKENFTTEAVT